MKNTLEQDKTFLPFNFHLWKTTVPNIWKIEKSFAINFWLNKSTIFSCKTWIKIIRYKCVIQVFDKKWISNLFSAMKHEWENRRVLFTINFWCSDERRYACSTVLELAREPAPEINASSPSYWNACCTTTCRFSRLFLWSKRAYHYSLCYRTYC